MAKVENWKQRMTRVAREKSAKEASKPKSSEVAKIYDTYQEFKSRDDGVTDYTPTYKHR